MRKMLFPVYNDITLLPVNPENRFTEDYCRQVVDYKRLLNTEDVGFDEETGTIYTPLSPQEVNVRLEEQAKSEPEPIEVIAEQVIL